MAVQIPGWPRLLLSGGRRCRDAAELMLCRGVFRSSPAPAQISLCRQSGCARIMVVSAGEDDATTTVVAPEATPAAAESTAETSSSAAAPQESAAAEAMRSFRASSGSGGRGGERGSSRARATSGRGKPRTQRAEPAVADSQIIPGAEFDGTVVSAPSPRPTHKTV